MTKKQAKPRKKTRGAKAKKSKPRASKYDPKLKIEGSFIDVLNAAVSPMKKKS